MPLYSRVSSRTFDQPPLVMCLEGWIDAGIGAAAAMASLVGGRPTDRIATWDSDELIDHRARRPVLHLADGVARGVTWPEIELRAGTDDRGQEVLLLVGPEPDMRWHAFAASVRDLLMEVGVRLVVGLGAFPAPVPHTREVRLVATAADREMAARVGFIPGTIDVPAGIQAVLEDELTRAGIPAVGLWARVPHYVVSMPYPAASAALVDGLAEVTGLSFSSIELKESAVRARGRIDELIANSTEHQAMVAQLEAQADREVEMIGPLPSGDELAAELERYLRGQGPGT
jgi:hypothetical protein